MYSAIKLGWLYIKYWVSASNGKGHGIHSPFVFELVTKIFNDNRIFYAFELIEARRSALLASDEINYVVDFGTSTLKHKKYGQLLFRLVNYFIPETVLVLNSSLGIVSCYLAAANANAKLITMEESNELAQIAKKSFAAAQLNNVQLVEGNIDVTLIQTLKELGKVNFAFINCNHRYDSTIRYFNELLSYINEQSILVFEDMHCSKEMEQAWEAIKAHADVKITIDLFFVSIVFFRKEQAEKEHFVIRY
jgi:predicted O-methyltransferase YrrM